MKIDNKSTWTFDLDDTLYSEKEYQLSGYQFIANTIKDLYNVDTLSIIERAFKEGEDVLSTLCYALSLPDEVKNSLLWLYRLHKPNIKLQYHVENTLKIIEQNSHAIAILTDGRSLSQRQKISALGLQDFDIFISEEWQESKPERTRFKKIQEKYPATSRFIYVGDNVKKDFIAPNLMGWITIGLKDNGDNIHSQEVSGFDLDDNALPQIWVNEFSDLLKLIC